MMLATPAGIDVDKLRQDLLQLTEVTGVHDLHVWGVGTRENAFSAHITVDPIYHNDEVTSKISDIIKNNYNISHVTIQLESYDAEA